MTSLSQLFFDAASLGGIYALAALGIALIFGVMNLVNFAHGEYITFCVFALIVPSTDAAAHLFLGKAPAIVLVPVMLMIGGGLAVLSEALIFRRLRNATPVTMMIASFALGFVLQYALLAAYGGRPKAVSLWPGLNTPVELLGASVPLLQLLVIGVTVAILVILFLLLRHTRLGLEMRAAAENFTMARMLGVKANRVITGAFAISGALAAAVALILVTQTGVADVRMGGPVMLVAFIATVIGGMGSLPGAVAAGFLLGAASVMLQAFLPLDARPFRDAFLYSLVIGCLLLRPQGLFASASAKPRV
ncbi:MULTISPECIES: branched-chain amino acid ABC transporter permease [Roseobacteraceae]|jgi:branched-chain amino acid transport system permease protein|nr:MULTISPECIES: branched-chain amino acid ABC transporter permease [unclassified Sulfitobacter]MEC9312899.1 branched-chain amino acid ABC transporter permease [Pseudomonadota bacterium]KZY05033.1 branched-chain amino acid ABC transporter permease [Sulfitobacter sp. HI0023]KZY25898.1 branched-chain amino acid ABC transporter permease [Sulfitobacter sp. HI0040]KZY49144.1 branched-chain amino acid ABC transporter permease [Sulfitobacter sp. HI0054]KZZ68418.1 branched-chain amino acid ABC transpo